MSSLNFLKSIHYITKPLTQHMPNIFHVPSRNTFILKRRFPAPLSKLGNPPKKLRARHYIYDLVEDLENRPMEKISVILTQYVEGVGQMGEVVTVKKQFARNRLLLPKYAMYATPENLKKCEELVKQRKGDIVQHSSKYAPRTAKAISEQVIFVTMNAHHPWTVEKFHISMALRFAGFMCPDSAIELPEEPISGPDPEKQLKDFVAYITINDCERFPVRCRIYHWSMNPLENDEITPEMKESASDAILKDQVELLKAMPKPILPDLSKTSLHWKK